VDHNIEIRKVNWHSHDSEFLTSSV